MKVTIALVCILGFSASCALAAVTPAAPSCPVQLDIERQCAQGSSRTYGNLLSYLPRDGMSCCYGIADNSFFVETVNSYVDPMGNNVVNVTLDIGQVVYTDSKGNMQYVMTQVPSVFTPYQGAVAYFDNKQIADGYDPTYLVVNYCKNNENLIFVKFFEQPSANELAQINAQFDFNINGSIIDQCFSQIAAQSCPVQLDVQRQCSENTQLTHGSLFDYLPEGLSCCYSISNDVVFVENVDYEEDMFGNNVFNFNLTTGGVYIGVVTYTDTMGDEEYMVTAAPPGYTQLIGATAYLDNGEIADGDSPTYLIDNLCQNSTSMLFVKFFTRPTPASLNTINTQYGFNIDPVALSQCFDTIGDYYDYYPFGDLK